MRYEVNIQTGEVTEHPDAPATPELPAPIPSIVFMRQARIALHRQGYLATVNAAVPSMGEEAQITWEYATEVRRDDALTLAMVALLGLTEQQADELFTLAASL